MARIIKEIEIEGKKAMALFDTGAYSNYLRKECIKDLLKRIIPQPYQVGLGEKVIEVKEVCIAQGKTYKD